METKRIYYNLSGFVLGNYWGGGKGAYPMHKFYNVVDLDKWQEDHKDLGSLDSGMGYENVYFALVRVEKVTVVEFEEDGYKKSDWSELHIGSCTELELEWLQNL